jgi:DNA-binding CsgD family transcriptional regulator
VARDLPDAPEPYELDFLDYMRRGSLNAEQREILKRAVSDDTQAEQAQQLHLSLATFKRRVAQLKDKLDLGRYQSLAAAAVELGFSHLWPIRSDAVDENPVS